jgi:hypothetical protein
MLSGLHGKAIAAHAGTDIDPHPGNLIMLRNPKPPMDPIWELRSGPHSIWPHPAHPGRHAGTPTSAVAHSVCIL